MGMLHKLAASAPLTALKLAIKAGNASIDSPNEEGRTPLWFAARMGRPDVVRWLLEQGADVHHADRARVTPLSAATLHIWESGTFECAQLLLAADADANLHDAIKLGLDERFDELLPHVDLNEEWSHETPIAAASEAGRVAMGRKLLAAGATPDVWAAAAFGDEALLTELLDGDRALLEAQRPAGHYHPLHCACETGQLAIVELLIARGADIEARNAWGFRPLHLAALAARFYLPGEAHVAIVERLLAEGAERSPTDDFHRTPVELAALQVDDSAAARRIVELLT